jgi:hypothetical protein
MTALSTRRTLEIDPRYVQQNARAAVRDIFDALTEIITNADDAYSRANTTKGRIEIEIDRRRGAPSIVRVRDFAGGFTHADMDRKLGRLGDRRNSGMAAGADVRGTNSRGAKDVAALGPVTFESVTEDGIYSRCCIDSNSEFEIWKPMPANASMRKALGVPRGAGTVVTVEVDQAHSASIPQHENLVRKLTHLVPLRDILADSQREVYLSDPNKDRRDLLRYIAPEGVERVKETFVVPGYPKAEAKLIIKRCKRPLENRNKFREGGILVKSRKAIHEATLFAPEYEHDPLASKFFGRLRCEYIDELWNEADERMEKKGASSDPKNPCPILDPLRQAGLRRDHPFFVALQGEVLKRLRPLVDDERRREAQEQAQVENKETRRKLNELERLATKFMQEQQEDGDDDLDNPTDDTDVKGKVQDAMLSPPFCQMVVGHSRKFTLLVNQAKYPELAAGAGVQVHCESEHIIADRASCILEVHPSTDGLLRASWRVTAEQPTSATGVRASIGAIVKQAALEVFATERDLYAHVDTLQFWRKRYRLAPQQPRRIRLVAQWPNTVARQDVVVFSCANRDILISGDRTMYIRDNLGIAECKVSVKAMKPDLKAILVADVAGKQAEVELIVTPPKEDAIKIELMDVDYKNQRYRWERGTNKLIIAAKHPSIRRYLGAAAAGFPGQEKTQFHVLLAEIVAFAVCEKILSRNIQQNPDEFLDADFDMFIAERDELVSRFLPAAHESQVPRPL